MKDTLDDYSLAEQMRIDQDTADQEIIKETIGRIDAGFEAAKEAVSDTLKQGGILLKRGRNSAEGYAEDAIHEVRHNPVSAMAIVFAGGAFAGGILALAWNRTKRSHQNTSADESEKSE